MHDRADGRPTDLALDSPTACRLDAVRPPGQAGSLTCQGSVRRRAQCRLMTPTALPTPSRGHATCAWCRTEHPTIVALLAHVDEAHLEASSAATSGRLARAA